MSFRELRNFTEMMRSLGYPRLISMENFRNPNFNLVAEILNWLVMRYDPNVDLPTEIDTEQDRVMFIKSVAQFMSTKANVKLNTKRLYQADGYAVKELLKISSILYGAMKNNSAYTNTDAADQNETNLNGLNLDITTKVSELKQCRQLASEITTRGVKLFDLLATEVDLRDARHNVIGKQLDISDIEKSLKKCISNVEDEMKKKMEMIDNVASDEANLEAKIEKKKIELERNEKRLQTLKSVRPAFMDEYERLEKELEKQYEVYLTKFRCLTFLEQQLEEYEHAELDKSEERQQSMKKMIEKMRYEEMMRNEAPDSLEDMGIADYDDAGELDTTPESSDDRSRSKTRRSNTNAGRPAKPVIAERQVFGSMAGEDSGSQDSDSDIGLDDEDDESASDLGTDDDIELADFELERRIKPTRKKTQRRNSDNDF